MEWNEIERKYTKNKKGETKEERSRSKEKMAWEKNKDMEFSYLWKYLKVNFVNHIDDLNSFCCKNGESSKSSMKAPKMFTVKSNIRAHSLFMDKFFSWASIFFYILVFVVVVGVLNASIEHIEKCFSRLFAVK